jgi:hypothetical protein
MHPLWWFLAILQSANYASSECTPCRSCKRADALALLPAFAVEMKTCGDRAPEDLRAFAEVYDLTCCPTTGFYHTFVDCLIPSLPTLRRALQSTEKAVAILPSFLEEYYNVLLPSQTSHPNLSRRVYSYDKMCYLGAAPVAVPHNRSGLSMPTEDAETLRVMLEDARQFGRLQASPPPVPTITIIQRHGTRSFTNLEEIVSHFVEAFPTWNVDIYHGNDTAADAVDQFAKSSVIVGWHGAGLAGALFSNAGTIVLEYTTLSGFGERTLWRTNGVIATIHGNLTWITHVVDIDRLVNGNATIANAISSKTGRDRSRYIKRLREVRITDGVLYNSIREVKREIIVQASQRQGEVR